MADDSSEASSNQRVEALENSIGHLGRQRRPFHVLELNATDISGSLSDLRHTYVDPLLNCAQLRILSPNDINRSTVTCNFYTAGAELLATCQQLLSGDSM